MKTFKVGVLLLCLSFFSSQLNAQSSQSKSTPIETAANDEIKIDFTDGGFSATFQNKILPVSNVVQLDNYLKSNPDLSIRKALIISNEKIDPELSRSLGAVLEKNKIKPVRAVRNQK